MTTALASHVDQLDLPSEPGVSPRAVRAASGAGGHHASAAAASATGECSSCAPNTRCSGTSMDPDQADLLPPLAAFTWTEVKRLQVGHRAGVVKALYASRCALCRDRIEPGQSIERVSGGARVRQAAGWVHRRCEDDDDAHTLTLVSDRCGAPTEYGRPCRNPVPPGDRCPVHRWDAAGGVAL